MRERGDLLSGSPKFPGIGKINSPPMRRRFLRASLNVSNRDEEPFFHLSFLAFYFFRLLLLSLLGPLAQSSLEESANLKARFNPRDLVDEISPGIRLTSISREVVRCPPGRETNDLRLGVGARMSSNFRSSIDEKALIVVVVSSLPSSSPSSSSSVRVHVSSGPRRTLRALAGRIRHPGFKTWPAVTDEGDGEGTKGDSNSSPSRSQSSP